MYTVDIYPQGTKESLTALLAYVLMSGLQFSQAAAVIKRLVYIAQLGTCTNNSSHLPVTGCVAEQTGSTEGCQGI